MPIIVTDRWCEDFKPIEGRGGHGARAFEHSFQLIACVFHLGWGAAYHILTCDAGGSLAEGAGLDVLRNLNNPPVM